jgi:acetoin utilization protein AcuB
MARKQGKKTVSTPKRAKPKSKAKSTPKSSTKAVSKTPRISRYMTRSPHTIGRDQTLERAHELMNAHRIRHLPVLDGGELVGLLSQRDMYFVEMLDSTPRAEVKVEEAMTQDVFEVQNDAKLAQVAATMLRKKLGCAVVTEAGKVVGVFSTTDALRALVEHLPAGA